MQLTDLIFLFCFVPVSLLFTFFEASVEYKNFILVVFSVVFFSWGRPFAVCLLFLSAAADWLLGLACSSDRPVRHAALLADAAMNLFLFLLLCRNNIFSGPLALSEKLLPVGAAYYTLRGFSYVLDVYRRTVPAEKNPLCLFTYMVSYPLMLAPPIVRYGDVSRQLRERTVTGAKLSDGISRITVGISKLALAVPALAAVEAAGLEPSELTWLGCAVGMLARICRVCLCWSGAADVSIGIGMLFGFSYPESFKPFDPFGLAGGLLKSFNSTLNTLAADLAVKPIEKNNRILAAAAAVPTVLLTAAWYGQSRMFLAGAALFLVLLLAEKLFLKKLLSKRTVIVRIVSCVYTCAAAFAVFSLSLSESLSQLRDWLSGLFGGRESYVWSVALRSALSEYAFVLAAVAVCCLPFSRSFFSRLFRRLSESSGTGYCTVQLLRTAALCFLLLLSAVSLAASATGIDVLP